jgi:hypothetical protein
MHSLHLNLGPSWTTNLSEFLVLFDSVDPFASLIGVLVVRKSVIEDTMASSERSHADVAPGTKQ